MTRVLFFGAQRLTDPLDETQEKKFRTLSAIADVHVIGFAPGLLPRTFRQHARFYLLPNPSLRLLRYASLLVLGTATALVVAFRSRIDVVVSQSPYEAMGPLLVRSVLAWSGRRVSAVVESHGDFENSLLDYRRIRLTKVYQWLMCRLARVTVERADALRAVSGSTATQLARFAHPHQTVRVFHTWTDLDQFTLDAPSDKTSRRFLYAGTLVPAKGVHHLLTAMVQVKQVVPDVRLLIVGHPENRQYAEQLLDQVRAAGLGDVVEFRSRVSQRQLAYLMRHAIALVVPSVSSEGLPRVILEAMTSGTAVVATAIAGAPEIVRDGENGILVPVGSPRCLARALLKLCTDGDLARRMGEEARESGRQLSSHGYREHYDLLFREATSTGAVDAAERSGLT